MERDEIERHDFPAVRRGYDPAAVDAHLRRVADELERRPASLAQNTSAQVKTIIEAAETSAQQLRDDAGREAAGHVERVGDAAKDMLAKLDRLQSELDRLLGGLKSTATSLSGTLEELTHDVGTLAGSATPSAPPPVGDRSDDEAGARLVALNMALEGTPREETARFLTEHYAIADLDALLDDVYTSAGK
jgi:DivIVA domain-containing protein